MWVYFEKPYTSLGPKFLYVLIPEPTGWGLTIYGPVDTYLTSDSDMVEAEQNALSLSLSLSLSLNI